MGLILFVAGMSAGVCMMLLGDMMSIILSDQWMVVDGKIHSIAWLLVDYIMPILSVLLLVQLLRRTKKG